MAATCWRHAGKRRTSPSPPRARERRHSTSNALRATGETRVDRDRAVAQAEQYLSRSGYEGSAKVEDGAVVVDVTITRRLFILGIAGFSKSSVTGQGRARPVRGVQVEGD